MSLSIQVITYTCDCNCFDFNPDLDDDDDDYLDITHLVTEMNLQYAAALYKRYGHHVWAASYGGTIKYIQSTLCLSKSTLLLQQQHLFTTLSIFPRNHGPFCNRIGTNHNSVSQYLCRIFSRYGKSSRSTPTSTENVEKSFLYCSSFQSEAINQVLANGNYLRLSEDVFDLFRDTQFKILSFKISSLGLLQQICGFVCA